VPPSISGASESARPPRYFAGFAWFVLAWNVLVGIEGAFVRATGSGAGCGNHWPLCNGQVLVGTRATATLIEFAHRSMTGIDTVLILALVFWAFRAFPAHHAARFGATLSTIFLVTEALIGAALVKFGLVVNDASIAREAVLSVHLTNTLTLLACITLTAWWGGGQRRIVPTRKAPAWKAWVSLAVALALAITGAMTALADTLYPVQSLAAGFAQDLNPNAGFALKLRAIHPFFAAAAAIWLVYYAITRLTTTRPLAQGFIAIVAAQLIAGAANLLLLTPITLQLLHLLLAYVLWITLVSLCWHEETPIMTTTV
jgi:heme A synthase